MALDETSEKLYNVRAALPWHMDVFAEWAARSEKVRGDLARNAHFDLSYGAGDAESLDLFSADNPDAPLHVFVHGGYWQALDKSDFSFIAPEYVARGVCVAVVNYGLCPDVTLDEIAQQVRQSLVWLWRNAGLYNYSRENIHVSGHSAGGHLVGMLMATDWPSFEAALPPDLVQSGISVSGLFDLEPLIATSINENIQMTADIARRNSPAHLEPLNRAPLMLAVGEAESEAFHWQSDNLAKIWTEKSIAVERLTLSGCDHLQAVDCLCDPGHELFRKTCAMIGTA